MNRLTGNIVSGHRRVSILDSLEKSCDYMIRVTPVEMDDKTEKEQNVFFNNREAQGDFSVDGLDAIMKDTTLDLENMGFDLADKFQMFGIDGMDGEEAVKLAEQLRNARNLFDKIKNKNLNRDGENFYSVVVFKDYESRLAFTNRLGVKDHRFVDGRIVNEALIEFGGRIDPEA